LQEIGEGGMGVVWMAEQTEPVRRRVALKIVKLGMDTKQVIGRFEAERQALALMEHIHIAKVFDAGVTDTGRPYFVMELVKGVPIAQYCDENKLNTSQRLSLFIQVCQAIQHAHQKGVIHRDIKPSNILVADHDGVPVPKIIDFGIAKATTGQPLTDKTVFTAFEQFIGTPTYMSPEQAKLSGLDIDTRSDIYSLGVLLYELLTGKTPFDHQRLLGAGLDEIRRIIREEDPPRPSTKLSTLNANEQTTLAKRRQSQVPKLVSQIRGDLDWIVMKALEKDRNRRYGTASDLALDIQRHMNNEPVTAVAPSPFYKFGKFVRRNKGAFAAVLAITTLLISGVIVSALLAVKARRSSVEARAERDKTKAALTRLGLRTADAFLARIPPSDPRKGLAILSRLLREDPSNRIAAECLLNALAHRSFLVPDSLRFPDGAFLVRWSKDGQNYLVAVTNTQGSAAQLYDGAGKLLGELSHGMTPIIALDIAPDAGAVATVTKERVRVWSTPRMNLLFDRPITNDALRQINLLPAQQLLLTAGASLALWDWQGGRLIHEVTTPGHILLVAISKSADLLAAAEDNATLRLYRVKSLEPLRFISMAHAQVIRDLQFNSDGSRLASAGADSVARIWDTKTGNRLSELPHDAAVYSVAFNPDSTLIATASRDESVQLWDPNTGKRIGLRLEHKGSVNDARFSVDGARLVSASDDGTAREWDLSSPRDPFETSEAARFRHPVLQAHFIPDGRILAIVEGEGAQILTRTFRPSTLSNDVPTPLLAKPNSLEIKLFSSAHAGEVLFTDISPDGRFVVTASSDKTARIWDRKLRTTVGEPLMHEAPVNCAHFSPDSQRVVTSASTGKIHSFRVWDVPTGAALTDTLVLGVPIVSVFFSSDNSSVIIDTGTDGKWAFPVRTVNGLVPEWLPRLGEAVAGIRLNDSLFEEAVPGSGFLQLKVALQGSTAIDRITTCAKQFLTSQPLPRQAADNLPPNGK